ncbi:antibiotic biosynthesis monooxygenase [Erythrobacter sp. sf7]|uniref:Antibiotic biosynthesis monooxygenase n=1 Tax=Erythrobacter fulvus TaxID=2987523 RepID=A0ABT5JS80_9SPHN|nr:antibiotic biosynthesis monooxygenase family protein [Erythrobacter fulvus]MDC8754993.1 antibiotic biosynthesis monooxygenase [Erythrobacter fulvus]
MTIVRLFRVRIHSALRAEFEAKFATISVGAVQAAQGALGVEILKPTHWAPDEYLMISRWRDSAAIKRFAGEHWNHAYIPPGMETFVADCSVDHYTAWKQT